jgi:hypothetical protein
MPSVANANRFTSSIRQNASNAGPAWKNANSMQSLSIKEEGTL